MQCLLFVFTGLPQNNTVPDLGILHEQLGEKYKTGAIAVKFLRKGELLSARLGEVSFYISFLKSKAELDDWFQMAADFELMVTANPVTGEQLLQRYDEIKRSSPGLYSNVHYDTAVSIFSFQ